MSTKFKERTRGGTSRCDVYNCNRLTMYELVVKNKSDKTETTRYICRVHQWKVLLDLKGKSNLDLISMSKK